ncbi:MAG: hypothetical protein QOE76_3987 [Frankiales bacterium]|nr:hypothetical protein [Frankiales bacterium]
MAELNQTYRVVVIREGDDWLADVPQVPGVHTFARNLPSLNLAVREAVALALDLPEGAEAEQALALDWEFHTGDDEADTEAALLRKIRAQLNETEKKLMDRTLLLAQKLRRTMSVRDVAAVLGVSPQRISQITPVARPAPAGGAPRKSAVPVVDREAKVEVAREGRKTA